MKLTAPNSGIFSHVISLRLKVDVSRTVKIPSSERDMDPLSNSREPLYDVKKDKEESERVRG